MGRAARRHLNDIDETAKKGGGWEGYSWIDGIDEGHDFLRINTGQNDKISYLEVGGRGQLQGRGIANRYVPLKTVKRRKRGGKRDYSETKREKDLAGRTKSESPSKRDRKGLFQKATLAPNAKPLRQTGRWRSISRRGKTVERKR